jgi:hypothetical protein
VVRTIQLNFRWCAVATGCTLHVLEVSRPLKDRAGHIPAAGSP